MVTLNPETAGLAYDTIMQKPTHGIPMCFIHPMEHAIIERIAGFPPGSYVKETEKVYLAMLRNSGACFVDQYIPDNPLTMSQAGYVNAERTATTGIHEIVCDGITISGPEDVVEHMERFAWPEMRKGIAEFDENDFVAKAIARHNEIQAKLAPEILKTAYNARFPRFRYGKYGYAAYFMAYALYPEVMEKDFELQTESAILGNRATVRACREGGIIPFLRLDHDMADSRGTLVDIKSLDKIWFPRFCRSLEPLLKANFRLIWHCDGNLMQMVPRLLESGLCGFQGFQYEDGMDYEKICKMKTRDGRDLLILGGVSVTRTLPHGKPQDVKRELTWLVDNGPKTGLALLGTSSIAPGVSWENIKTLIDGFHFYRKYGRSARYAA